MIRTQGARSCAAVTLWLSAACVAQLIAADAKKKVHVAPPSQLPVVQITSPGPGASFAAQAPIAIAANATDADGTIRVVRFFDGDTRIGSARTAPYAMTWRHAPVGTHTLTAIAIDNLGAAGAPSAPVTVVVKPDMPPTVTLTSPVNHATFTAPATVSLAAAASDLEGPVRRVDYYAASAGEIRLIGRSRTAPYAVSWMGVAAGEYTLAAVATDSRGLIAVTAPIVITVSEGHPTPTPETAPLVQPGNLIYEGAFRVPDGLHPGPNLNEWQLTHGLATFAYGGLAMGVNAVNTSLFMVGNNQGSLVAEIGIPTLLPGTAVTSLNVASLLQPFSEPTEGRIDTINPGSNNSKKIGGLLPDNGKLYLSTYDYYDGNGTQLVSHFVSGLTLATTGDVTGPLQVGTMGAGFVDGYFGVVPPDWQAALGGPVVNGNCCLGVISRTSYGPALFTIDPAQLGITTPLPARPLVYYPAAHPLLDAGVVTCTDRSTCNPVVDGWSTTGSLFNGNSEVRGVVFPGGFRSVLFFGRHGGMGGATVPGNGNFCYGFGTADPALVGTKPVGELDPYCYDPEDGSKGVHGYPYRYYVWAYDVNDLAAAAAGTRDPWTVKPYAAWPLTLPFATAGSTHLSATYDPQAARIYLSQYQGDGVLPLIYVFKLQ